MKRALLFIPLVMLMGLFFLFNQMIGQDPSELQLARKGQPVPDFSLPELFNPQRLITAADLKGEPMLVNLWATWCPACRVEHPYLLKLHRENRVKLVGLNYKDDRDGAIAWLNDLGNSYQFVIFDEQGRLGLDLGAYGAPETYVIDAEGIIRYRHVGIINEKVWSEVLAPLIESFQPKAG